MSAMEKPNKEEIEKINKIFGVSDYVLRGETFKYKDYLKSYGWYWDKISNGWRLDKIREDDRRLREVRDLEGVYLGRP